jgi:hypothetical protein
MSVKINFDMDQKADLNKTIVLTDNEDNPIDYSSYTAFGSMAKWYTSNTIYNFNITLNSNNIVLSMDANTTINIEAARYVYDVFVQKDNITTKIIEGIITVNPSV